ncbi:TetR/AcrR family transcriptional regulator [Actinomadura keratinilytica]
MDAAEAVLFEQGTQALTLSAVADRAGVSKGGLLYHFPTKEALVTALVRRVIAEFDELIDSFDDGSPTGYSRAYVQATFQILTGEARAHRRWSAITAAATDPDLAAPSTRRWPAGTAAPARATPTRSPGRWCGWRPRACGRWSATHPACTTPNSSTRCDGGCWSCSNADRRHGAPIPGPGRSGPR